MSNSSKSKLYFFTYSFPYGLGESWKANELAQLSKNFDEITIIPYNYDGNHTPRAIDESWECKKPLFESEAYRVTSVFFSELFTRNFFFFMREFFRKPAFSSKKWLLLWISATSFTTKLLRHPTIKELIKNLDSNTTLYFFWGEGSCKILPFIPPGKLHKALVRFHGYDLFEEDYNGYLPYRTDLLNSVAQFASISQTGAEYMKAKYPNLDFDISVRRLGVIATGDASASTDDTLRIVTCAMVIPLKRLHLLAEALKLLDVEVEWTHIGDGELMDDLKESTKSFPSNINVKFTGWVKSEEVMKIYKSGVFDLFINTSETEGVPVSVMEAFSASIPVLATNVGGTREIVDESTGGLLPADLSSEQLALRIMGFHQLSHEEKNKLRSGAKSRFREMCDAKKLTSELAEILS